MPAHIYRLPNLESRWVWNIEDPSSRLLLEVGSCVFMESGYWAIYAHTMPERPFALHGLPNEPRPWVSIADEFWGTVTPVGGRIEDLSHPVSKEQYYGDNTKERST